MIGKNKVKLEIFKARQGFEPNFDLNQNFKSGFTPKPTTRHKQLGLDINFDVLAQLLHRVPYTIFMLIYSLIFIFCLSRCSFLSPLVYSILDFKNTHQAVQPAHQNWYQSHTVSLRVVGLGWSLVCERLKQQGVVIDIVADVARLAEDPCSNLVSASIFFFPVAPLGTF